MKYFVISYDADQQQNFCDFVSADDHHEALCIISDARSYAIPIVAFDAENLATALRNLTDITIEQIKKSINALMEVEFNG